MTKAGSGLRTIRPCFLQRTMCHTRFSLAVQGQPASDFLRGPEAQSRLSSFKAAVRCSFPPRIYHKQQQLVAAYMRAAVCQLQRASDLYIIAAGEFL
jgi:hypothetical protein